MVQLRLLSGGRQAIRTGRLHWENNRLRVLALAQFLSVFYVSFVF
jgi:hypothetical protein